MNIARKFVIFLFIFILFGFLIIIYNFQNKSDTYVLATISNDSNQIHQQRKIVLLDLNKNKIIKELYSYNEGHTLEAAVSPDKRKLAVNKWTNHMDLNLFTIDLNTGKEFQLTNNINGEIERISWINNDEILYTFTSHNPKKDGLGTLIYVINTKTGRRRLIDGIEGLKAIYWYNTVKYIPQIKKIVMVRGLADDFFKPAINDTIHAPRNQLYLCDINGKNQKKLCEIEGRTIGRVVASPNGEKLIIEAYYTQGEKEPSDLYIYDLKRNKLDLLLKSGKGFEEHWNIFAPDNENLLFRSNKKLYKMNLKNKSIMEFNIINAPPGSEFVNFDYY